MHMVIFKLQPQLLHTSLYKITLETNSTNASILLHQLYFFNTTSFLIR